MTNRTLNFMLSFFAFSAFSLTAAEQAVVTVKLVDEFGEPVPNAGVEIGFNGPRFDVTTWVSGKTNAHGMMQAKGWPKDELMDTFTVQAKPPGYYASVHRVDTDLEAGVPGQREFEFTLPIRKMGKPTAMYAKKVELELPEQRKDIGFDFEKGDWVKPYGKGEVADCIFFGTKIFEDNDNYKTSVIMSFPGQKEGLLPDSAQNEKAIQLSKFKTTRLAPQEGYEGAKEFVSMQSTANGYSGTSREGSYIFRSRVVLDESGKIKSANYGKMLEAVGVTRGAALPDTNPKVKFTYYFNPTPNDTNLEFDPEKNLFPSPDGNLQIVDP